MAAITAAYSLAAQTEHVLEASRLLDHVGKEKGEKAEVAPVNSIAEEKKVVSSETIVMEGDEKTVVKERVIENEKTVVNEKPLVKEKIVENEKPVAKKPATTTNTSKSKKGN